MSHLLLGILVLVAMAVSACRPPEFGTARQIRIAIQAEPESLDPQLYEEIDELRVIMELCEGLVAFDSTDNIVPASADSWIVSPDGLTYTFHLRPHQQWDDGVAITSADYVYAARRWVDPATAATDTQPILNIRNATEILSGRMSPGSIGVTAPDENTVEVRLEEPDPYFLEQILFLYPLRADAIRKWGSHWARPERMRSNGPYRLVEWVPQGHMKLTRNPRYWDARRVVIDSIVIMPVGSKVAFKLYQAGELDVAMLQSHQFADALRIYKDQLHTDRVPYIDYLALNLEHSSTRDLWLRRALALVLDQRLLFERIVPGVAVPGFSMLPDGIVNANQYSEDFSNASMKDRVTEAQELFAKAGISRLAPVTLVFGFWSGEDRRLTSAIAAMWVAALPVRVQLEARERQSFFHDVADFDVSLLGMGELGNPLLYLSAYHSEHPTLPSIPGYADKTFDAAVDQVAATVSLDRRLELMQKAQTVFFAKQPIIPLGASRLWTQLVSPRVHGWKDNRGLHPLSLLRVD
jgi:oligopeptide transport system substrate-binding protein